MSNATPEDKDQTVASMTGIVDHWKARIDELRVRADLGKLDVRDKAEKQLEIAQNACLAGYSKLRDARHDTAATADQSEKASSGWCATSRRHSKRRRTSSHGARGSEKQAREGPACVTQHADPCRIGKWRPRGVAAILQAPLSGKRKVC